MENEGSRFIPVKKNCFSLENLKRLSHDELVNMVIQLRSHNDQLKNIISKQNLTKEGANVNKKKFDFSRCEKLHILLKILYFGWDYQGFATQDDTTSTVEYFLFNALLKCHLIQSRETSNYHRCGRTDKGVSAFSQVVSITVRARGESEKPLEYCKMLNRLLPEYIRIIAWQPISEGFSARFNCKNRTYRYYFPKGSLNLKVMNEASQHLVGTHDFRNFCKMDVANGVTNFIRSISSVNICQLDNIADNVGNGYEIYALEITSPAFLWHQIRCIMSVLFLVGMELEKPSIVKDLLNINENPRKPQYPLAHYVGLNLFKTEFDSNCGWLFDEGEITLLIEQLQKMWTSFSIKSTHIRSSLYELENLLSKPVLKQTSFLIKQESKVYKPLLLRGTCSSLEDRINHYVKKRKISPQI